MLTLHIMINTIFIEPFIMFINKNFNAKEHFFVIFGGSDYNVKLDNNINNLYIIKGEEKITVLQYYLYKADKIIIHGLFNERLIQILYFQPWLLKKSYWVMWGGDFLYPEINSWQKKQVIKKIQNIITNVDGDVDFLQKNYNTYPKYYKSLTYLSNIFDDKLNYNLNKISKDEMWILVGNSASGTNRHEFILNKLTNLSNQNIRLITPLSYCKGNGNYPQKIIELGKSLYGDKFEPITNYLEYDKYIQLLFNIDIALFAHKKQESMGNIIHLLGFGKKVYLDSQATHWSFFYNLGLKIYDIKDEINLNIELTEVKKNTKIIKEYFSEENLKKSLGNIFNS